MRIEILFPEFCNLFGDMYNMRYLKMCVPEAEFIETALDEVPAFVNEDINLIYLGPMTEKTQEKVIKRLMPYKERIEELIEKNVFFLFTGNAVEVLGKYIENEDGSKIEGVGIFDVYAKRNMMYRHNSYLVGMYGNIEIVGFKSQFTMMYGDNSSSYFLQVEKGIGINEESKLEGIKKNNFIGTYLLGPILIENPLFTEKVLQAIGAKTDIALKEDTLAAYEARLNELKKLRK